MMITLVTVAVIRSDGHAGEHPALITSEMERWWRAQKRGEIRGGVGVWGGRFWGVTVILRRAGGESERRREKRRDRKAAQNSVGPPWTQFWEKADRQHQRPNTNLKRSQKDPTLAGNFYNNSIQTRFFFGTCRKSSVCPRLMFFFSSFFSWVGFDYACPLPSLPKIH